MITDVNVYPLAYSNNNTVALASVIVDNAVAVNSIAVKCSQEGELYLQLPQKLNKATGQYEDIFFPITKEARDELNSKIFDKLQNPDKNMDIKESFKGEPKIDVNISRYQKPLENGKIGSGTMTVGDSYVVKNVSAFQRPDGSTRYTLPQYKSLSGKFKSIVAPASKEMHPIIENAVNAEVNTQYSYYSVDNQTFKKLRDEAPEMFKQCSGADGKNVKIKFPTENKAEVLDTLAKLSGKNLSASAQATNAAKTAAPAVATAPRR